MGTELLIVIALWSAVRKVTGEAMFCTGAVQENLNPGMVLPLDSEVSALKPLGQRKGWSRPPRAIFAFGSTRKSR